MRTRRRPQSSSDPVTSIPATSHGTEHRTVLLHEAIDVLSLKSDSTVVDATLGAAGHAKRLVQKLSAKGTYIGFDLDADALLRATIALREAACKVILISANFRDMRKELLARDISHIDAALFDLGWNTAQLAAKRGFSFLADEPLLMTYANHPAENAITAAVIVNEWAESSLADIIYGWGEERYSRRIAKAIVERRVEKPFTFARELAEVIRSAVPAAYRRGRLHPATKTFQALRIAVNDEMGALKDGLLAARSMLNANGRIAVITFHSVEDRIVKRMFVEWEAEGRGKRITKKPILPTADELAQNPRARSAKLRVYEHISTS